VAVDGDGRVYACDEGRCEVVRVNPATGNVETLSAGTDDTTMTLPNMLAFDPVGNLYVTDSGDTHADNGLIFRISPSGGTEIWTRSLSKYPNGCCVDASGARARRVRRATRIGKSQRRARRWPSWRNSLPAVDDNETS
jgi:sugar lactone lactonase YvrE